MPAHGADPHGVMREVSATSDPADSSVAVVVARAEDLADTAEALAAVAGADSAAVLLRHADKHKGNSVVDIAVDQDQWARVVWVPWSGPEDALAAGARLAEVVQVDAFVVAAPPSESLGDFLTGWLLGGYRFSMKSEENSESGALLVDAPTDLVQRLSARADAVAIARDLTNTPSNFKTPQWFVDRVTAVLADTDVDITVLDETELQAQGFGGMLAVGSGSSHPPRLLQLTLHGNPGGPTVALVGKGITFDSGGLSIKPADAMVTMKTDMSGAAAVVGAMVSLAAERGASADATIIALLPLAENMPSGSAYRPGDVVRHFGGRTTEVSNTDAEGRMVLADALVYAQQEHSPDVIVDVATLTGAAKLALSADVAALFANNDDLAAQLLAAATTVGETAWRLPLQPEYERFVDSEIADTTQSSTDPQARAGAITAALFLKRFVADDVAWAHLDIAGPARSDRNKGPITAGGTGYGVRLLTEWLGARFQQPSD